VKRLGAITLAIATFGQVQAQRINYAPDIMSDSYWDTHRIGVVRITATGQDGHGSTYVVYQLERQISSEPIEQAGTVPVSHFLFGSRLEEPQIALNDRFILFDVKEGPEPIAATKLDGPDGSHLLKPLVKIAELRSNRDLQGYLENVFADDPVVSQYSLRHLLAQAAPQVPAGYVARLLRLRGEEWRETTLRVLAARLASRLDGQAEDSDAEYPWLQASQGAVAGTLAFCRSFVGFQNKAPRNGRVV